MSDVPAEEIPPLLLHTVPESAVSLAEKYRMPAEAAVLTREAIVDMYEVLAECFTTSVLIPQLESSNPEPELLRRCWDFVERLVDHSLRHVSGAVYFEVLEPLLNADGLVEAAWPHMKERSQARTVKMLNFYGIRVPGINAS